MLRLGLALYLMLAASGGPWFCCCMAGQVAEFFSPTSKKQENRSRCCTQHCKEKGQTPSEPSRSPASCPCHATDFMYLNEPGLSLEEENIRFMNLFTVALESIADPSSLHTPDDVEKESIAFPVRSSQDILRALHILRC